MFRKKLSSGVDFTYIASLPKIEVTNPEPGCGACETITPRSRFVKVFVKFNCHNCHDRPYVSIKVKAMQGTSLRLVRWSDED